MVRKENRGLQTIALQRIPQQLSLVDKGAIWPKSQRHIGQLMLPTCKPGITGIIGIFGQRLGPYVRDPHPRAIEGRDHRRSELIANLCFLISVLPLSRTTQDRYPRRKLKEKRISKGIRLYRKCCPTCPDANRIYRVVRGRTRSPARLNRYRGWTRDTQDTGGRYREVVAYRLYTPVFECSLCPSPTQDKAIISQDTSAVIRNLIKTSGRWSR